MKITLREKRRHARSRFARSTISEEKWGTTGSLTRWLLLNEGVIKKTVNFTAMIQIRSFFVFLVIYVPILNSAGINFDWLNGWKCSTLVNKNVSVDETNTRFEKWRAT